MRRLFTVEEAVARGLTRAALRWGERTGSWRRIDRQVYTDGPWDPDAVAIHLARGGASAEDDGAPSRYGGPGVEGVGGEGAEAAGAAAGAAASSAAPVGATARFTG